MKQSDAVNDYKRNVIYDYVKLRWHHSEILFCELTRKQVLEAYEQLQEECPGVAMREPEFTTLPPSRTRPDGMYIVEVFGYAANLIHRLPWSWCQFLTYAHVKSFSTVLMPEEILDLGIELLRGDGRRQVNILKGGKAGRSRKGVKSHSIRIGSRKSDLHFMVYARQGQRVGVETRWRGDSLAIRTVEVNDRLEDAQVENWRTGWHWLSVLLARDGARELDKEFISRGKYIEEVFGPFSTLSRGLNDQAVLPGVEEVEDVDMPSTADD